MINMRSLKITICLVLVLWTTVFAMKPKPVAIIFDTDIAPDYDDVGALAMLHAFADKGEAKILATVSSNAFETTVPTISVINQYFNRADIPVGVVKKTSPNFSCQQQWAQDIIARYPHTLRSNADAMEATALYRKVLAAQKDQSVTIVTVGFFSNLAALLQSEADAYSPLNGRQLVQKKVKRLVSMAGIVDSSGKGGYEFNVTGDIAASQKVLGEWPTPMVLSGFEIGVKVLTGMRLIRNNNIQNSPVKDAYAKALAADKNTMGRNSWDQTAVWVAVRGIEPFFGYRRLNLLVNDDGRDSVTQGNRIMYLTLKQSPERIAAEIEELMMHQPVRTR